jgi:hypothetical protein
MRTFSTTHRFAIVLATAASASVLSWLSRLDATPAQAIVATGQNAVWVGDSYQGASIADITLQSGQISDPLSVSFLNEGPFNWDADYVLAQWNGSDDGPPLTNPIFCHLPTIDWWSCYPRAIPAWIGYGTVHPGEVGTFQFQLQAPGVDAQHDYTLYFRPAFRARNGDYEWIDATPADGLPGNRSYEVFNVHVLPNPP